MTYAFAIVVMSLLWATANGHHAGVNYDRENIREITGEVTYVSWRNPHIRLRVNVTEGSGEVVVWTIESGPLNIVRRLGVDTSEIQVGDTLTIAGPPERSGEPMMFASNFMLSDGRELVLSSSAPHRWTNAGAPAVDPRERVGDGVEVPRTLFRVWSRIIGRDAETVISMTESAAAAQARWDPINDDVTLRCIAPGMIESMVGPVPIELVDNDDEIDIRMEAWDARRTVAITDSHPPLDREPALQGYSTGRWENDDLVITTSRPSWPYLNDEGVPMSPDAIIVERFTVSEDGRTMDWVATITDPANLTEPAVIRQYFEWIPSERIERFDCQLPEEE